MIYMIIIFCFIFVTRIVTHKKVVARYWPIKVQRLVIGGDENIN